MALRTLLGAVVGRERSDTLFDLLVVHPALAAETRVTRAVMAQALNMALFDDLLARVPDAAAYAADCRASGRTLFHDHGAVRTVAAPCGALPSGQEAITRLLRPLGYEHRETYPLDRLRMTGRSWGHADFPEDIAQFFVSELHPDRFQAEFQAAVARVIPTSTDPLTPRAEAVLDRFQAGTEVGLDDAAAALPVIAACFDRHHAIPTLADYDLLLAHSAEMAWIATEGNAFNHATDRVADVERVAAEQRALGRPMKDTVEVSGSGRVRQTAFRAARVERRFLGAGGRVFTREVPGSFYEFIQRERLPDAKGLDLGFDSGNAQGIFRMTAAA